jgi:NAD(P)-dependent dehydrogenase (short-subunit alcohol dehydrogenase family)
LRVARVYLRDILLTSVTILQLPAACSMPLSNLSHVVGLVTGGASGLGLATASTLFKAGARVVVADLPHQYERFLDLERHLRENIPWQANAMLETSIKSSQGGADAHGPYISFIGTDVTCEDQVNKALDAVEVLYGEPGMFICHM